MQTFYAIVFLLAISLFLLCFIFFVVRSFLKPAKLYPPFIPSRKKVISRILPLFESINSTSVVFELGSGDGRVLCALSKAYPSAVYCGVEKQFLPYALSYIRAYFLKKKRNVNISFQRKDFYDLRFDGATHIFAYLSPQAMNAILPKLERELPRGGVVVSLDFLFVDRKPYSIVDLSDDAGTYFSLGTKLYIYHF